MNDELIRTKQILNKISKGNFAAQWITGQPFFLLKDVVGSKGIDVRIYNQDLNSLIKLLEELQEIQGEQGLDTLF